MQQSIDGNQKTPAAMAIANAVIGSEGHVDDGTNSKQAVQRRWPVDDLAEAHQRHLGRIDHTENAFDSLLAEIGDSDGAVGEFLAAQMAGARAVDQVEHGTHKFIEIFLIDIVDCRVDQTALAQ